MKLEEESYKISFKALPVKIQCSPPSPPSGQIGLKPYHTKEHAAIYANVRKTWVTLLIEIFQ